MATRPAEEFLDTLRGPSCAATYPSSEPGIHSDCCVHGRVGLRAAGRTRRSGQCPRATDPDANTAHAAFTHGYTHNRAHSATANTDAGSHPNPYPHGSTHAYSHPDADTHADAGSTHPHPACSLP